MISEDYKHIVFGEGKHDVHFMCMALNKCLENPTIDWFLAEDIDGELAPEEEPAVREFVYRRESGHLVKSEEGDSNLYRLFGYYCEDILRERFKATIIADLDQDGIGNLINNLQESLDDVYAGAIEIENWNEISGIGDLQTWKLVVTATPNNRSLQIPLITFEDDLEAAAGIDYEDGWYDRSLTINNYASDPDVKSCIEEALM